MTAAERTATHSLLADYFRGKWADGPKPFRPEGGKEDVAADRAVMPQVRTFVSLVCVCVCVCVCIQRGVCMCVCVRAGVYIPRGAATLSDSEA